jgi:hypothetical protein
MQVKLVVEEWKNRGDGFSLMNGEDWFMVQGNIG